jgi:hypothetical protein
VREVAGSNPVVPTTSFAQARAAAAGIPEKVPETEKEIFATEYGAHSYLER